MYVLSGNLKFVLLLDAPSSSAIRDTSLSFDMNNTKRHDYVIPEGQLPTPTRLGSGPRRACHKKYPLASSNIADVSAICEWISNLLTDLKSS